MQCVFCTVPNATVHMKLQWFTTRQVTLGSSWDVLSVCLQQFQEPKCNHNHGFHHGGRTWNSQQYAVSHNATTHINSSRSICLQKDCETPHLQFMGTGRIYLSISVAKNTSITQSS